MATLLMARRRRARIDEREMLAGGHADERPALQDPRHSQPDVHIRCLRLLEEPGGEDHLWTA